MKTPNTDKPKERRFSEFSTQLLFISNERVFVVENEYFGQTKAFTDFGITLCEWAGKAAYLAAPTKHITASEAQKHVLTPLPINRAKFLPLAYSNNRYEAIFTTLGSMMKIRRFLASSNSASECTFIVCPATNSTSFLVSLFRPRQSHIVYLARGDTIRTLSHMLASSPLKSLIVGIAKFYRYRECSLVKGGKATLFAYGDQLADSFQQMGCPAIPIAPILDPLWIDTPKNEENKSNKKKRLLFAGRFSPEKNLLMLLDVVSELLSSGNNLTLTLVGEGPQSSLIKERVATMGLNDYVTIEERMPVGRNYVALFDQHDIFCMPSLTEGMPRVVAEAIARELIVVSTPVGGVPSMTDGNCHISKDYKSESYKETLEHVLESFETHSKLSKSTSRKTAVKFLLTTQAELVGTHLEGILRQ